MVKRPNIIKGLRGLDPLKHPRDTRGRFVETPDPVKVAKQPTRVKQSNLRQQGRVVKGLQEDLNVARQRDQLGSKRSRADILANMTPEQGRKLAEVLKAKRQRELAAAVQIVPDPAVTVVEPKPKKARKPKAPVVQEVLTPVETPNTDRVKFTKNTDKKILKKYAKEGDLSVLDKSELTHINQIKAPTPRYPGSLDDIQVGESGRIKLWDDPDTRKFGTADPDFKVRTNKKQRYSVTTDDGTELTLNNHSKTISYQGETVEGVPSLHPKLRAMSDKSLIKALIETKGYVESKEEPPAPKWLQQYHGSVNKQYVAQAGYGSMEIHHINQWAKTRFDNITGEYENGLITKEEAQDKMRSLLRPNPREKIGYEIDIQGQDERKFVILAAGTHNVTSPLYFVNHPKGIHPDTGEMAVFGIPKTGSGGRSEFNKFRSGFWREVYKKETYSLLGELNRRVSKGLLDRETTRQLLKESYDQGVKNHKSMVQYSKWVKERNTVIVATKASAGISKKPKKNTNTEE
ncbi:MAG: hypothetical protein HEQ10_03455 [Dolichospermum sp. DEX182a]|nr:hypothetical protein [Dolichospermum sp. DEX182a]